MTLLFESLFLYWRRLLRYLSQNPFHLFEKERDVRSVHKSMAYGQCDRHVEPSGTGDGLACIHQRIVQGVAYRLLCVGDRREVEFRCGTQQEYIKIPLGGYLFVGSVRIAVFRNGGYYLLGFLIERAEILVVGDAYRIESLSRTAMGEMTSTVS